MGVWGKKRKKMPPSSSSPTSFPSKVTNYSSRLYFSKYIYILIQNVCKDLYKDIIKFV